MKLSPSNILSAVAGLILLGAPAQVSARTWAGGVDMEKACSSQYGSGFYSYLCCNNSAFDWSCATEAGPVAPHHPIDVGDYCRKTYGQTAYSDPQGGGPWDWGCYFP